MHAGRIRRRFWLLLAIPIVLSLLAIPAGSIYYTAAGGKACIRCHEIQPAYDRWMESTHRNVECRECHGSIYSTDAGFHLNNVRQLWLHLSGQVPERLLLRQQDISRGLNARCGKCHQQEYAAWTAGPHHATYSQIFLDPGQNTNRIVSDFCLQCHGMYFEHGIRDLVQPIDLKGPWHLVPLSIHPDEPAIPCSACHAVHRHGLPMAMRTASEQATNAIPYHPSLSFYCRCRTLSTEPGRCALPPMRGRRRVTSAMRPITHSRRGQATIAPVWECTKG